MPLDKPDIASGIVKSEVEATWKGAVIQIKTTWLQYAGVEWKTRSPWTSPVLFSPAGDNDVKARLPLNQLMDVAVRGTLCKQIILGARSGTFISDGLRAKVKELVVKGGKLTKVKYDTVDEDDSILFEPSPKAIGTFFREFKGAPSDASRTAPA